MRVAVTQFGTTFKTEENLVTCIRIINEAAACKPTLIVLPEYSNTLSCYSDHNQAWNSALSLNGDFLQSIAAQAIKHDCYITINVTLQRDCIRDHQDTAIKSNISVTSCLFSPSGELIQQVDKHALIGHENTFFTCGNKAADVLTTPFGKLGLLSGSDSIMFDTPRKLALGGAQLLCNAINSFARDQSDLYDPARACENNVFVATANKIGSLISNVETHNANNIHTGIGHSQIVSPCGFVLAKIANDEEGYAFADIDLIGVGKSVGLNHKVRPDGTTVIEQLRPELYQTLIQKIDKTRQNTDDFTDNKVAKTANVAIFATYKSNNEAIDDVCYYIENNLSDIIQLPELFFVADKTTANNIEEFTQIAYLSKQLITKISNVLRPFQYVCTSLVIEGVHQAVIINEQGLLATQQQLHFCKRYQWTTLGDKLHAITLPLEQGIITVAMLVADDAHIPEIVKIARLKGIHLLLVPFDIQEPCEVKYTILSHAAENRICILAASREKNFVNNTVTIEDQHNFNNTQNKNKVKLQKSTGLIANLATDYAFLPQWKPRKFTDYLNQPIVKYQYGKITKAVIHPIAACHK